MICGYCNGAGQTYNSVRGISSDCLECAKTGVAKCHSCGGDAALIDDDGDYTCGDCWFEAQMETDEGDDDWDPYVDGN